MADALLSPAVGLSMWGATAGVMAYCSLKVQQERDERRIPLMGVLGAFIFAAQMINFTIPATGSSGHLGGGLLLAILLGPHAAFLTIASVLVVQSLFFADGGILALGCNIFNLGVFPAFIAYPFVYKKLAGAKNNPTRISLAAILASVLALQLGAFAVVVETVASGVSSLPFSSFVLLMQPIHLAIGLVEGAVTAAVVSFVCKARPDILRSVSTGQQGGGRPLRNLVLAFLAAALLTGGVFSWFASENPDGLEWSIAKITGTEEVVHDVDGIHGFFANLQEKLSFLPDYGFKTSEDSPAVSAAGVESDGARLSTSVSGFVGGLLSLAIAFLLGTLLRRQQTA